LAELSRKERERLRRKEDIIQAAKKLFAEKGYKNTSMNAIAEKADFSKRTLYQYFENKSDLYFSVALQIYEDLVSHLENTELTEQDGFGKIKEIFFAYYEFYKNNEEYFKIIYDIGKVRQESNNPKLKKYFEIYKKFTDDLKEIIIEGQNDGSVSKELDPELTTQSLIFILTGIFNQLTITGDNFSNHIGITKEKFSNHVLNLIHTTLKDD
jgi:AcrR family transcriptional regulator